MTKYILIGCEDNVFGSPLFFSSSDEAYARMKLEMSIVLYCSVDELDRLACGDNTYLRDCEIGYNYDKERYEGSCKVGAHKMSWMIIECDFNKED